MTDAIHRAFCQWAVNFRCSAMVSMLTVYSAHDDEGAISCVAAAASNDALNSIGCLRAGGQTTTDTQLNSRELEYAMAACCEEYGPETAWSQAHRATQEDIPDRMWCAMVTKTFTPRDPESRCKEAMTAVDRELTALRSTKCWDKEKVTE